MLIQNFVESASREKFVAETPTNKENHSVLQRKHRYAIDYSTDSPDVIVGTPQIRMDVKRSSMFTGPIVTETPPYKQNYSALPSIKDSISNSTNSPDMITGTPQISKKVKRSISKSTFVGELPFYKRYNSAFQRKKNVFKNLRNSSEVIMDPSDIFKKIEGYDILEDNFVAETPCHEQNNSALQRIKLTIHDSTNLTEVIAESPRVLKKVKESDIPEAKLSDKIPSDQKTYSPKQKENVFDNLTNSPVVIAKTPRNMKKVIAYDMFNDNFDGKTLFYEQNNSVLQRIKGTIRDSINSPKVVAESPQMPKKVKELMIPEANLFAKIPSHQQNHSTQQNENDFYSLSHSPEVFGEILQVTKNVIGLEISKSKFLTENVSQKKNYSALQGINKTVHNLNDSSEVIPESPQIFKKVKRSDILKDNFVPKTLTHEQNHSALQRIKRTILYSINSPEVFAESPQISKKVKESMISRSKLFEKISSHRQNHFTWQDENVFYNLSNSPDVFAETPRFTKKFIGLEISRSKFVRRNISQKKCNSALQKVTEKIMNLNNFSAVVPESPQILKKVKRSKTFLADFVPETPSYKQKHSAVPCFIDAIHNSTNSPYEIVGTPQNPKKVKQLAIPRTKFVAETPSHKQNNSALNGRKQVLDYLSSSREIILESPLIKKKIQMKQTLRSKIF